MKLSFTFLSKKNKGEHFFSQNKYKKTNKIEKDWARLIFLFFVDFSTPQKQTFRFI